MPEHYFDPEQRSEKREIFTSYRKKLINNLHCQFYRINHIIKDG